MAKPSCTFCNTNEGILMATNLDDGDTQIICPACLPGYALGMAAGIIGGMTRDEGESYADAIDQVYANDPRGPKAPPAKPPRKPRKAPPAEVAPDGAQEDATTAVELPEPCGQCGGTKATGDRQKLTCDGCGAVIATAGQLAG